MPKLNRLLAVVVLPILTSPALLAQHAESSVLLAPGAIIAADGQELYAMRPEGGVDALETATGRVRWSSVLADQPLLLVDCQLIALAETPDRDAFDIVILDAARGTLRQRAHAELPSGTRAAIEDDLEHRIRVEAFLDDDEVLLIWHALHRSVRGVASELTRQDGLTRKDGAWRLGLASGVLTALPPGPQPAPRSRQPIDLAPQERLDAISGRQFRDVADRVVMASEPNRAGPRHWDRYRWTLYDSATAERLGEVQSSTSYAPFFVADDMLLVMLGQPYLRRLGPSEAGDWESKPLHLRVIDLRSGAEVWVRPLRDTTYYGPFPD